MNPFDRSETTSAGSQEPERTAAEWALRRQQGLTRAEERALARWLASEERHRVLLAEMEETSLLLDQLHGSAFAGNGTANDLSPTKSPRHAHASRRVWIAAATGLAAAVAIIWALPAITAPAPFAYASTAATEVGDLRRLELPDGTVVHVNTDTALTFDFTPAERRVNLTRGEAFFEVASRRSWPFRVDAADVTVRAVGTAFNVRYRPDAIKVLVSEGKVSVDRASATTRSAGTATVSASDASSATLRLVGRGEQAVVALATSPARAIVPPIVVAPLPRFRFESALAWKQRRLEFTGVPLREVVAEFNRYNRHQLIVEDSALAEQTFGGAFASNGYTSFVDVLEQSFGVRAERSADRTVLRRQP